MPQRRLLESLRLGAELRVPGLRVTRLADEHATALAAVSRREDGWYADLTVADDHVFAERIFCYRRGEPAARAEAIAYGHKVGTPGQQLDWGD
jgi:hypothetical protein